MATLAFVGRRGPLLLLLAGRFPFLGRRRGRRALVRPRPRAVLTTQLWLPYARPRAMRVRMATCPWASTNTFLDAAYSRRSLRMCMRASGRLKMW